jgi:hypothetical protein
MNLKHPQQSDKLAGNECRAGIKLHDVNLSLMDSDFPHTGFNLDFIDSTNSDITQLLECMYVSICATINRIKERSINL